MKKKLPGFLITVGVLNLILAIPCGGCSLVNAILTGIAGFGSSANVQPTKAKTTNPWATQPASNKGIMGAVEEQMAFMNKEVPYYSLEQVAHNLINTFVALLLGIAAIGLFMGKPWGRTITVVACIGWCLWCIVHVIYTMALVVPAQKKFHQMNGMMRDDTAHSAGVYIGLLLLLIIPIGYTIMASAFLFSRKVKDYFANPYLDQQDRYPNEESGYNKRLDEQDPDDRWGS